MSEVKFRTTQQIVGEGMDRIKKIQNPSTAQIEIIMNWVAKEVNDQFTYEINHHAAMAEKHARALKRVKLDIELQQHLNQDKYKEELELY